MHPRRIAAVLVPTLVAALTAAGGVTSSAPAAAAQASARAVQQTTHVHVRPVDRTGHLKTGYHVTANHGRTRCMLGGIAVGTAYRCFAGNNYIFDPCWLQAGGTHHVVCLRDPWRHGVVRLHVTRGFLGDHYGPVLKKHPWGIQLVDGTRCIGSQGAAGTVGSLGISYICLDRKTVLLEDPDTSDPLWRIRVARDPSGGYDYHLVGYQAIHRTYAGRRSLKP